jgi:hypothetical protein
MPTGVCGFTGSCTVYSAGGNFCRNYVNLTCAQAEADCDRVPKTHKFDPINPCSFDPYPGATSCAGCPDQDGQLRGWDCSLGPPC